MPNLSTQYYYETDECVNPYGDCYYPTEIKCDYVIPTPEILCNLSNFDVPPPIDQLNQKFIYTLKNGQKIELDHPLPPGFPIESLDQLLQQSHTVRELSTHIDKKYIKELFIYCAVGICPFSGFLFYWYFTKKNPKLARNIKRITFTALTVIGTTLLLLI